MQERMVTKDTLSVELTKANVEETETAPEASKKEATDDEEAPKSKKLRRPSDFIEDDIYDTKLHILAGLQKPGMHVYGGTVDPEEVKRRRAKNKRARAARRKNR